MRISDWSSDVCSSDLKAVDVGEPRQVAQGQRLVGEQRAREQGERRILGARDGDTALQSLAAANDDLIHWPSLADASLRASGAVGNAWLPWRARDEREGRWTRSGARKRWGGRPGRGPISCWRPPTPAGRALQIGRASCRERVGQYV